MKSVDGTERSCSEHHTSNRLTDVEEKFLVAAQISLKDY